MQSVCVFCGANVGRNPQFRAAAAELGQLLARRGLRLVYGGGSVGLMGAVADAVLSAGGQVTGVIPHMLATKELLHAGVADMRRVPNMHARKALMAELADAFITLPGGLGTLEEFFEIVTWAQLGIHRKNIGLLNVAGYFDPLLRFLDHAIETQFCRPEHRDLIVVETHPDRLLDRLAEHHMPATPKWLALDET